MTGGFFSMPAASSYSATISVDTSNVNIFALLGSPGVRVDAVVTINPGIKVWSPTSAVAMHTGTGWVAGSTLLIVNHGSKQGRGGNGGAGSTGSNSGGGGNDGHDALEIEDGNVAVSIDNTDGEIFGGGGGGGGGGGAVGGAPPKAGGGGGGGRGHGGGNGGPKGSGAASDGGDGSVSGPGGGGAGGGEGASGGNGGGWGASGSKGANSVTSGGSKGAAGRAVRLNGHTVTWLGGYNSTQVKGAVS